jgi:hypothetical protein
VALFVSVQSGLFSNILLERGTGLNVVDNSADGILQITPEPTIETGTTTQQLVTIENTLNTAQTVTVELDSSPTWSFSSNSAQTKAASIAAGGTESFLVDVSPSSPTGAYTYTITSTIGSSQRFTQEQSITIEQGSGSVAFEDFEDCSLSDYTQATGTWSIDTTVVQNGSCSATTTLSTTGSAALLDTTSGTHDTEQGFIYRGWVRTTGSASPGYIYGLQTEGTPPDGYYVRAAVGNNELQLYRVDGGFSLIDSDTTTLSTNQWYLLEYKWYTNDTIETSVFDSSFTELGSLTLTDATYTSGGFGVRVYGDGGTTSYWDNVTAENIPEDTISVSSQTNIQSSVTDTTLVSVENLVSRDQVVEVTLDSNYGWTFNSTGTQTQSVTLTGGSTQTFTVDTPSLGNTTAYDFTVQSEDTDGTVTESKTYSVTVLQISGPVTFGVFEDFEACTLADYGQDSSGPIVLSDTISYEGNQSAVLPGGETSALIDVSSGNHTTSAGNTYRAWIRTDSTSGANGMVVGAQTVSTTPGGYYLRTDTANEIRLWKIDGSFTTLDSTTVTINSGDWYQLELDWAVDGTLTGRVYDTSGTLLGTVSGSDTTFSSGGFGFRYYDQANGPSYVDNITATGTVVGPRDCNQVSLDPADYPIFVDGFEDGNLDEYDKGGFGAGPSTQQAFNGSYSARIYPTAELESNNSIRTPIAGETWSIRVYPQPSGAPTNNIAIQYAVNGSNAYEVSLRNIGTGIDGIRWYKRGSGTESGIAIAVPLDSEWYEVEIQWGSVGTQSTAKVFDSAGSEIYSYTFTDSEYTNGELRIITDSTGAYIDDIVIKSPT